MPKTRPKANPKQGQAAKIAVAVDALTLQAERKKLPSGKEIEVPDGTTPEAFEAALKEAGLIKQGNSVPANVEEGEVSSATAIGPTAFYATRDGSGVYKRTNLECEALTDDGEEVTFKSFVLTPEGVFYDEGDSVPVSVQATERTSTGKTLVHS